MFLGICNRFRSLLEFCVCLCVKKICYVIGGVYILLSVEVILKVSRWRIELIVLCFVNFFGVWLCVLFVRVNFFYIVFLIEIFGCVRFYWIWCVGKFVCKDVVFIVVLNYVLFIDFLFYFYELFLSIVSFKVYDCFYLVGIIICLM